MVVGHRTPEGRVAGPKLRMELIMLSQFFNLQACKLAESPTVVPLKKGHIYQHRSTAS